MATDRLEPTPEMCECGHPVSDHKITLIETQCKGKASVDGVVPVWVMSKPCACRELRVRREA